MAIWGHNHPIFTPFSLHLWSNLPEGGGNGLGIHGMGTSEGQKGKLQRKGENMAGLAKKIPGLAETLYCLFMGH